MVTMNFGTRAAFALILALGMAVAGCKENTTPSQPTAEAKAAQEQTVVLEKATWVRDSANILSKQEGDRIAYKLKKFQDSSAAKPQIVVITAKSLGDKTIEEFANDEYKRIKIGNVKHDNGILIVVAPKERKLRIEVGYGFEGSIPDMVANQIIKNDMVPNLKKGSENWYKAIDSAVDSLISKAKL